MRFKLSTLLWIVTLAGIATAYLNERQARLAVLDEFNIAKVVVAARDLNVGETLGREDLEVRTVAVPKSFVTSGVTIDYCHGGTTSRTIYAGMPINLEWISGPYDCVLPLRYRVICIKRSASEAENNDVRQFAKVDVYAKNGQQSNLLAESIKVFSETALDESSVSTGLIVTKNPLGSSVIDSITKAQNDGSEIILIPTKD